MHHRNLSRYLQVNPIDVKVGDITYESFTNKIEVVIGIEPDGSSEVLYLLDTETGKVTDMNASWIRQGTMHEVYRPR